jgi:hypothetical protein
MRKNNILRSMGILKFYNILNKFCNMQPNALIYLC